jgi:hypothetical protein
LGGAVRDGGRGNRPRPQPAGDLGGRGRRRKHFRRSGSVYGAAIGAVIFAVLQNGVQLLGINQFWLQAVVGAAILVTVFFYSLFARRAEEAERMSRHRAKRR